VNFLLVLIELFLARC